MSERKVIPKNQEQMAGAKFITPADLGFDVEGQDILAPEAFATVVRGFLQNNRQGTVGCKTRAEVSGSNKKPWKQKGTGRARCGARTSPLWRGGGIIFGPQSRDRKIKITKGLRRAVARELLKTVLQEQRLVLLDWQLSSAAPKTREAFAVLREQNLHTALVNVFLSVTDAATVASFANIPSVRIIYFDAPNVYALADAHYWIVCKKDVDAFKSMSEQWK